MCSVSNLFPLINVLGAMSVYLTGVFDLNFCCACWVRNPLDLFPSPWNVQVKKIKIPQDQEVTCLNIVCLIVMHHLCITINLKTQ